MTSRDAWRWVIPGMAGGAAGSFWGGADEAEAKVRDDILKVVQASLGGRHYAGQTAGTLESQSALDALLSGNGKYRTGEGYFTEHGLIGRKEKDQWTAEQIADGYLGIYNSPNTVVIPNVMGVSPNAQEALWIPKEKGRSFYMPIVPFKKGFKGVTLYDPQAAEVAHKLKDRGYWEGGSTSSIFTPSLEEGLVQPVGSGPISAVNPRDQFNSLGEALRAVNRTKSRKNAFLPFDFSLPLAAGSALGGAAALPGEARAGTAATFGASSEAEAANIGPHGAINLFGTPPTGERRTAPSLLDSLTQAYLPDQTPRAGYGEEGGNTLISRFQGHPAQPSTQLLPLSAVTPQPEKSLGEQPEAVKKRAQSAFLMNQGGRRGNGNTPHI